MKLSKDINVYLKTTETCNLNCAHCFTSGRNGARIFFNPRKVADFFTRLRSEGPEIASIRYIFHGGEPFLAPIEDLHLAHELLKDIFPTTTFGMQSNLVFPLDSAKRTFLNQVIQPYGFGTSWDYDIRFGSVAGRLRTPQLNLWEKNVRTLIEEDGHEMTLMVSITKSLIENKDPIDIIRYAVDLGFKHILFERITADGNAKENSSILPTNRQQDQWLHQMFEETMAHKLYEQIDNMLLSELAEGYLNHNHVANRCRRCEQSLLTINADGSIAGCPNTGPEKHWGHIHHSIYDNLNAKARKETIRCEAFDRNPACFSCPAFEYCNSDCNKLAWDEQGTYCAAPKGIWTEMMTNNRTDDYQKLLFGRAMGVSQ
jgi:radical SAM protein with 4Fe4S-binding SPASM domain